MIQSIKNDMKVWKYFLKENENYYPKVFYDLKDKFDEIRTQIKRLMNDPDVKKDKVNLIIRDYTRDYVSNIINISSSSGSFRRVIVLDKDFIMKFAINKDGLHQNEQEVYLFTNTKYSDFFPKVYEVDKQFFWILEEKIKVINYFNEIPLNRYLLKKISSYQQYEEAEYLWKTMNWALVEISKLGGIQNLEKFYDLFVIGDLDEYRGFAYFLDSGIYKTHADDELIDLAEKNIFKDLVIMGQEDLQIKEMLIDSIYSLFSNYLEAVNECSFTKSIINLGLEIPNMAIWDIRSGNIGYRYRDGVYEVVIIDSSLDIPKF